MSERSPTDGSPKDCSREIMAAVASAAAGDQPGGGRQRGRPQPLYISAGGSKRDWLGRSCEAQMLDVSGHTGIIDYQPSELVITARAGTTLVEIFDTLAQQGQTLPCESPTLGGRATLGGTLACNLSGPARPWGGSIRDLVLGVKLINGRGELLKFGGQVMKNVAGYDVSRLQAGAMGTLGVLSEISLKVLPRPEHSLSLGFEIDAQEAIATMNRFAGKPAPLSGACWLDGRLYLRLAGARAAVEHTARSWGGDILPADTSYWRDLREMSLPFFAGPEPLWRFSVSPAAPLTEKPGEAILIDWGGAQRWLRGEHDLESLQQTAAAAGGHVTLVRGGNRRGEVRPKPEAVAQRLQQRLKQSFDPRGVLNPGRLYTWL